MNEPKRKIGCLAKLVLIVLSLVILIGSIIFFYLPKQLEGEFSLSLGEISPLQRILYTVELYKNRDALKSGMESDGEDIHFEITDGESVEMICLRLEEQGLIPSAELFRMFLIYFGLDRNIQSGTFTLSPAMSDESIAKKMADPLARDVSFTILPGWRIEEIANSLPNTGLNISPEAFIDYAYNSPDDLADLLGVTRLDSLEGFLFPGSYPVKREITLDQLMRMVISNFTQNVDPDMRNAFTNQGLSLLEAVSLASIIERETNFVSEQPMIASVFYNRLASGMRLETDPTVQYALGYDSVTGSWWKSPLSFADLEVNSAYNTYLINGLPPGPISNPALSSLQAIAYPADTPYFYFRAACDGSKTHNFAVTYDEHLLNACP